MKRAIFILVLLTVGVMLPPLYSRWTESRRQKQIQAVKQRIQQLFDAPEAEELFCENIKRAAALGIQASLTILVDGHSFRANQLLRASGTPCQ